MRHPGFDAIKVQSLLVLCLISFRLSRHLQSRIEPNVFCYTSFL